MGCYKKKDPLTLIHLTPFFDWVAVLASIHRSHQYPNKSQNSPVELIVRPEQGNQGDHGDQGDQGDRCDQDNQGEVSIIIF